MAVLILTGPRIFLGASELTAVAAQIDTSANTTMKDATTFASGGFEEVRPGLTEFDMAVTGYADHVAPGTTLFVPTLLGTQQTAQVHQTGGVNVGDPAILKRGKVAAINQPTGNVGGMAGFYASLKSDTAEAYGYVGAPGASRGTGGFTGAVVTMTGPITGQSVYAALNVYAAAGTNLVVKLQSATLVGFGSPTDRITFSTMSATGSQFASLAGPITDGFWRILVTIASGTFSFAASMGVT